MSPSRRRNVPSRLDRVPSHSSPDRRARSMSLPTVCQFLAVAPTPVACSTPFASREFAKPSGVCRYTTFPTAENRSEPDLSRARSRRALGCGRTLEEVEVQRPGHAFGFGERVRAPQRRRDHRRSSPGREARARGGSRLLRARNAPPPAHSGGRCRRRRCRSGCTFARCGTRPAPGWPSARALAGCFFPRR